MKKLPKKKIVLYIDTRDNKITTVSLIINRKKINLVEKTSNWTSQVLLPMISKILKINKISEKDITEIVVENGPGSFTGVRVGIAVVNMLGFLLKVPVNGQKKYISKLIYN